MTDPVLRARRADESTHLQELVDHADRIVLEPWSDRFSPRDDPNASAHDLLARATTAALGARVQGPA